MGKTSYHAEYYKENGQVDRKKECDAYFEEGMNRGHFKVLKSTMRSSVYYAAVKGLKRYNVGNSTYEDVPEEEQKVFAAIFLTEVDDSDYFNFTYKDMDETFHPFYYDCPKAILNLLSPTENKNSLQWRENCRKKAEKKKDGNSLSNLPVGSIIRYIIDGDVIELMKHEAAYQFKRPFWYLAEHNRYVPAKRIPGTYEVIRRGY